MSINGYINSVTNGLVFYVDAANSKSYVSGSTDWYDISSNNNVGTLTNGTFYSPNNSGTMVFDGTDDYVSYPNSSSLAILGDMSINCWLKVTDFNNYRGIVGKTISNKPAPFDYYLNIGTGRMAFLRGDGLTGYYSNATQAPTLGVWQNISVTMSGDQVTHYINGVLINQEQIVSPPISVANGGGPMYVGSRADNVTMMYGDISTLQIYNICLSQQEILQNYNATKWRFQ